MAGQNRNCLLDSGADVSVIPTSYVNSSCLQPTDRNILVANSTRILIDGEVRLPVIIGNCRTEIVFVASPNVDEVIVGRGWLSDNDVIWHFRRNEIKINGQPYSLQLKPDKMSRCSRCVTQSDTTVQARSEALIPTHIIYNSLRPTKAVETWTTTPMESTTGLHVARTVVDSRSGEAYVRVCNVTEMSIHLPKGQLVSQLQKVDSFDTHTIT